MKGTLTDAGHRLRGYKCGVWAAGFEQCDDKELPTEVRNLCLKLPRNRHGVSLLGSAANMQYCMHAGLGQPAEPPPQTNERVRAVEDAELPMEVRNLCLKIPRKRHGVSLLGSAAKAQHCLHVGLGQPAEVPTQTIERVEKVSRRCRAL